MLKTQPAALIRPIACFNRRAGMAQAVLGGQRQRAAQGVQAKQRIGAGHQRQRGQRRARQRIPADHVAKRLVHTHAVQVHRQALRRAQQRRGGVAAVIDIGLQGVALHVVDMHAAQLALEKLAQGGALAVLQRGGVAADHRSRHLRTAQPQAWQRRGAHHGDLGQRGVFRLRHCRAQQAGNAQ